VLKALIVGDMPVNVKYSRFEAGPGDEGPALVSLTLSTIDSIATCNKLAASESGRLALDLDAALA
jgi:hypothetical protein